MWYDNCQRSEYITTQSAEEIKSMVAQGLGGIVQLNDVCGHEGLIFLAKVIKIDIQELGEAD